MSLGDVSSGQHAAYALCLALLMRLLKTLLIY